MCNGLYIFRPIYEYVDCVKITICIDSVHDQQFILDDA